MRAKWILLSAAACLSVVPMLAGCASDYAATTPSYSGTMATGARVLTYPDGRYELRGNGTTVPYYWVWIPAGVAGAYELPAPPLTATPSQNIVTYPNGRYELRGNGTSIPYYWVWVPTGATPPWPPAPFSG